MIKTKSRRQSKDKRIIKEQARTINRLFKADESQHFGGSQQGFYREDAFRPSTSEDYLQLFETYGHLFACVDAIARNAAGIPLKLYNLHSISASKDRIGEEITDGNWWELLNTPNKFTSGYGLVYSLVAFQQLTGTAYLEKVGPKNNLTQLWSLRPDWMKIIPDAKELIGGYEYDVDGEIIKYTQDEVFRFRAWHPRSELYGLAPVNPAQNAIITDLYCSKYTKQFFKQGGHLNWYLKVKEELGDVAFKRMEQQLKTKFAGLENAHSPAIIDADGELKELGGSPDRNTLLPQKTLSRKEVCEVYGVPPVILGFLDEATYNNAKEQERIFWEQKLMPLIGELVSCMNREIFWPNKMEVKPDYSGISVLQTAYNEKAPAGKTLVDGKIMTPNEVRKNLFGLEPLDGGDEFPQPAPQFGYGAGGIPEQKSELPTMLKVMEILLAKGGSGSGHHEHYGRPGGGSHPKLTEEKIKEIEKDIFGGNDLDAFDKLRSHGLTVDETKKYIREAKGCADTAGLINRVKPKKPKAQREAIVKAMADHRNKQVAMAYTDIEKVTVEGYKAMGQAVLGVVGKIAKAVAFVKKDVVAEAIASLDGPTKEMAKKLLSVEKEKLKPIIEAEFRRAKNAEPDKETLDELNRKVGTHLERMIDESADNISKTNSDRVEKKLTDLLESDATTDTIRKEFQELFEGTEREGPTWARTVARTEALKFTETSRFNSLSEMGFGEKEWFHSGHEDARPDHEAADGEVVPMNKKFSTGLLYPGDPNGEAGDVINCFPGSMLLDSPGGINKIFRSVYDGEFVTIKFSDGESLTGTPNHPILTDCGWVAIGKLNEGHNIICTSYGNGASLDDLNINNVIPSFHDVFNSLCKKWKPVGIAGINVNFYGDVPASDVDVIDIESELLDEFNIGCTEKRTKFILSHSDFRTTDLLGNGLLNFAINKKFFWLTPYGSVRGKNISAPLTKGHLGIPNLNRIAYSSTSDSIINKNSFDDASVCASLSSDALLGHSGEIVSDDFRNVCLKKIVSSHRFTSRENVYTIESPSKIYISNGVIAKNCGCTFSESVKGAEEEGE